MLLIKQTVQAEYRQGDSDIHMPCILIARIGQRQIVQALELPRLITYVHWRLILYLVECVEMKPATLTRVSELGKRCASKRVLLSTNNLWTFYPPVP